MLPVGRDSLQVWVVTACYVTCIHSVLPTQDHRPHMWYEHNSHSCSCNRRYQTPTLGQATTPPVHHKPRSTFGRATHCADQRLACNCHSTYKLLTRSQARMALPTPKMSMVHTEPKKGLFHHWTCRGSCGKATAPVKGVHAFMPKCAVKGKTALCLMIAHAHSPAGHHPMGDHNSGKFISPHCRAAHADRSLKPHELLFRLP